MTIQTKYDLRSVKVFEAKDLAEPSGIVKVSSNELIGIEIEIENTSLRQQLNQIWQVKGDGSLRNNGQEFVSYPMRAALAPAALNNILVEGLEKTCCFSPRTSVHVHLNCQDMEPNQVIDMIMLYSVFERLFYRFAGRGRHKNIYCVPLTSTEILKHMAANVSFERWEKYTGLNARTLAQYGTLEFRHMHGTFDVNKLCIWINIITKLKEYVMNTPSKQIRADITAMSPNFSFQGLLQTIFKEFADYFKYKGFQDVESEYALVKTALIRDGVASNLRAGRDASSPFYIK